MAEERNGYTVWWESWKDRNHYDDLDTGGRLLKLILNYDGGVWTGFMRPVAGFYEQALNLRLPYDSGNL
jgi:hypothetical protein